MQDDASSAEMPVEIRASDLPSWFLARIDFSVLLDIGPEDGVGGYGVNGFEGGECAAGFFAVVGYVCVLGARSANYSLEFGRDRNLGKWIRLTRIATCTVWSVELASCAMLWKLPVSTILSAHVPSSS